jgi:hypothetical protein
MDDLEEQRKRVLQSLGRLKSDLLGIIGVVDSAKKRAEWEDFDIPNCEARLSALKDEAEMFKLRFIRLIEDVEAYHEQ